MIDTIAGPATFSLDDLGTWLATYDIELRDVRRIEILPRRGAFRPNPTPDDAPLSTVYMRIERNVRDESGHLFAVHENGESVMATERLLIPLRDLP